MRNNKVLFAIGLLAIVLVMSVGYTTLTTDLRMNGSQKHEEKWDVQVVGIETIDINGSASAGNPSFNATSVTFDADLIQPGDSVTYRVTIENKGTIDATLAGTTFTEQEDGSPAIIYSHVEPASTLEAGAKTTFTVTASYDDNYMLVPDVTSKTITGLVQYTQAG